MATQHSNPQCNTSGRSDQMCANCQNEIRRATKRNNNYKAHGPCQSNYTRTWVRKEREKK